MDERKPRLIPDDVVAPDLADVNLVVLSEAACDVHHGRRDVQMKRGARAAEVRPLGERFEMVHRFARFHLDDDLELVAPVRRHEEEIGV